MIGYKVTLINITLMKKEFTVIIEQDEDGSYIGEVAELHGCHTQASSLDELMNRIKEAIELYLEVNDNEYPLTHLVGIQKISV